MKFNDKAEWIKSLGIASDSITTTSGNPEDVGLTFITNFGFVVASIASPKEFPGKTDEELKEYLASKMKTGLDAFDANVAVNQMMRNSFIEEGATFDDSGKHIIVENAEIIHSNNLGSRVKVDKMVLFSDQIVGIIPKRIQLKT